MVGNSVLHIRHRVRIYLPMPLAAKLGGEGGREKPIRVAQFLTVDMLRPRLWADRIALY